MITHDGSRSHLKPNLSEMTFITNILFVQSQLLNPPILNGRGSFRGMNARCRDSWGPPERLPTVPSTWCHFLPHLISSFPVQDVLMKRTGDFFLLSSVSLRVGNGLKS